MIAQIPKLAVLNVTIQMLFPDFTQSKNTPKTCLEDSRLVSILDPSLPATLAPFRVVLGMCAAS